MRKFRKALAYALTTAAVSAAAITAASAACSPIAGTWHVFMVQVDVNTGVAIKCKLELAANGAFSGNKCQAQGIANDDAGSPTVSGRLFFGTGANACAILRGTVNVPHDPPVNILGGYLNGNHGSAVARQGQIGVFLINFVRQ